MRSRLLPLLLVLPLLVCAGCGGGGGEGAADGGKKQSLRIAVIPKGTSHDFWLSVRYGAEKAAKELSVDGRKIEIEWQGTAKEGDKAGQKGIVETFIGRGVDGICLAPIDRDVFGPVVKEAGEHEVPVVLFDSGLSEQYMPHAVSYVATDNLKGGLMAGEHLAKLVRARGGSDGVIMLRYEAGSESTEQRETGFSQAIAKADLLMLNDKNYTGSDAAQAASVGESLLRDHPDVAGVFTVCEPANKGMWQALVNEKRAGEVLFVAFDPFPRQREGLKDGSVHGIVLQDPVNMGYEAVKTMVAHLDGEQVEKRIDTGVYLATPENMEEPTYKALLDPKKYGVE